MKAKFSLMGFLCPKQKHIKQKIPILTLAFVFFQTTQLFAQQPPVYTVHGTVFSKADGLPLPGATVKNQRTNVGMVTNADGSFRLVTSDSSGVLMVSFIGFNTTELKFDRSHTGPFRVLLAANPNMLNEVTVSTGYQTLPRERATGSFAQVDNQLLNRRVSTDVLSRLEGVVPGLLFNRNTSNGSAGQTDISIKGNNTLFANNQPLLVVDGFTYEGDLNNINPNDVEQITVLKDAAAASIWGVRSGNGVIVITTKSGKKKAPLSVDLNASVMVGERPDLFYSRNSIASSDFIGIEKDLFAKGFYDSDLKTGYVPVSPVVQLLADQRAGKISAADADARIGQLGTLDLRKQTEQYLYRPTINQQYALNLRGGSERSTYFFSIGNNQDRSYEKANEQSRLSISSRLTFDLLKNLQLTAALYWVQTNGQNNNPLSNYGLSMGNKGALYPYAQLADANGNALAIPLDYGLQYSSSPATGLRDWNYRPLDELQNANNRTRSTDNRVNLGLSYKLVSGLSADVKYQYEHAETRRSNVYGLETYYARNLINRFAQGAANGTVTYPVPLGGILQEADGSLNAHQGRLQLSYNHLFPGMHEVTAIAGTEINANVNQSSANTAYGYNEETQSSNAAINFVTSYRQNPSGTGSAAVPTTLGFGKTTDHYLSYYANTAYTYAGKYTLSLSARIDQSNLFGVNTNQKGIPLYSAGTSWLLSKEKFYPFSWLPYLKVRATFGYNGNINKNATAVVTLRQFNGNLNQYDQLPFAQIANPGNPELRWEKVQMLNLGLDFASKRNVVSGSVEIYHKKGIDLFGYAPLYPSTGQTTYFGNTASTAGNGIDVTFNVRVIDRNKWKWTTGLLFSHVLDKVTKYEANQTVSNFINFSNASSIIPLKGNALYGLYSYQSAELDQQGNPQGYLGGTISTDYAGILSKTTIEDMVYHGSARPTSFGSVMNSVSYGGISLSANIIYKLGYYFRRSSYTSSGLPYSGHQDYYGRWQKTGDELNTSIPALRYPPYDNNRDQFYKNSSTLITKGDHIRLQDLTLSYTLDQQVIRKLPFNSLQLYTYVNNVGLLWNSNKQGLDPDLGTNSTASAFPLPRTYSLGLKANF
jgi:TonB-linked SusC/RagA family outer membrane protein